MGPQSLNGLTLNFRGQGIVLHLDIKAVDELEVFVLEKNNNHKKISIILK